MKIGKWGSVFAISRNDAFEMFPEQGAVHQAGQRIIVRQLVDFGFVVLAIGGVLDERDQVFRASIDVAHDKAVYQYDAPAELRRFDAEFHARNSTVALHGFVVVVGNPPREIGREHVGHRGAEDGVGRDPVQAGIRPIDKKNFPRLRVLDDNRHRQVLNDGIEEILDPQQFLFCVAAIGDVLVRRDPAAIVLKTVVI